jgi:hypothetical protein
VESVSQLSFVDAATVLCAVVVMQFFAVAAFELLNVDPIFATNVLNNGDGSENWQSKGLAAHRTVTQA